jgi:hypothetical protein
MRYGNKTRTIRQVGQWQVDQPQNAVPWYSLSPNAPVSSGSTSVAADTAAHTKGAWVEIIASNAQDTSLVYVTVTGVAASTVLTSTLMDIGVGAAGSEVVVAENINIGSASVPGIAAALPVFIASGARIAARIQSVVTGGKTATIAVQTHVVGSPVLVPSLLDVLGADTAASRGTALTGASGSYTQIVASTSKEYAAIGIVVAGNSSGMAGLANLTLTAAVGAAGSEVDAGRIVVNTGAQETIYNQSSESLVFPVKVPVGSRLSVKHNIPSSPGNVCVVLIGVPA